MASTRALEVLDYATEFWFDVPSGSSVTKGQAVKPVTGGVADAGAAERGIGVARDSVTGAAGARVLVRLFGPIMKVLVGTGGATLGASAATVADGMTDAAVATPAHGIFLEAGVATQIVAMVAMPHTTPA